MKAIGGYFELELNKGGEFYPDAIALNTGRNALELIFRNRNYKKVYVPYFTCDVILEPFEKLGIIHEFYRINEQLEPIFDFEKIDKDEAFLYTNYFGLKSHYIEKLSAFCNKLIIDNSQAFFSTPIVGVDTFYSPRKFFGVSDGAYLFCENNKLNDFPFDDSYHRMSHLLIRSDKNAEAGYSKFIENDKSLKNQPIKKMSLLTKKILSNINYDRVQEIRRQNFDYLHNELGDSNKLKLNNVENETPLVYPFWTENKILKNTLQKDRIFCATYWPNTLKWSENDFLENILTKQIIHLPIDQRYGLKEMKLMLNNIT